MFIGVCSVFIGLCMMLMVVSLLTPWSALSFMRVLAAVQWGLGGVAMCMMCRALWRWGRTMLYKKITLDENGVDFRLGTKKNPAHALISWSDIQSIEQKRRMGNNVEFTVRGADGEYGQFTGLSFFRPRHVAKLIAERAGVPITNL